MFIIAHFLPPSTLFSKFAKVFRFGVFLRIMRAIPRVSCARACACMLGRAWACVTRVSKFARFFRRWGVAPFWVGFGLLFGCACGGILWGCFGVVVYGIKWANVNGNGERIKANGARAHGERVKGANVNGRTACPFSSVRQILSF